MRTEPSAPHATARSGARRLALVGILFVLVWSAYGVELRPIRLLQNLGQSFALIAEFFPLDLSELRHYLAEMVTTVQIAVVGSALAIAASIPLALLASANVAPRSVRFAVRRVLDALRIG